MRTIIDLPPEQKERIVAVARSRKISLAELIRQIISAYLQSIHDTSSTKEECFGLWSDKDIDGVTYQQQLRNEWNSE